MKHLKSFKIFESQDDESRLVQEITDIFQVVEDFGLEVDDIHSGTALSMGGRDIIFDHNDFEMKIGPDGKWEKTFKSLSVRIKSKSKIPAGAGMVRSEYLSLPEDIFSELDDAIGHVESQLGLELNSLYLRTSNGVWFKDVDTLQKWIEDLPFAQRASLKWVLYLDLTFKINEQI